MSEDTLSKADIEKRVDDWGLRISNLYTSIKDWLSSDPSYTVKEQSEVTMNEELMQKYQVPPKQLKVLDIYSGDHIVATFKPIGLWIIGTNGRVDILSKNGAVLLIDKSEKFQKPNWVGYARANKDNSSQFNKEYFFKLLEVIR